MITFSGLMPAAAYRMPDIMECTDGQIRKHRVSEINYVVQPDGELDGITALPVLETARISLPACTRE